MGKAKSLPLEWSTVREFHFGKLQPCPHTFLSKVKLRVLPKNISLGFKWLTVINTLAYYNAELIESFEVKARV